jgi:hypothetical protein
VIQFEDTNLYFSPSQLSSEGRDGTYVDDIDIEGPISRMKSDQVASGIKGLAELASGIVQPLLDHDPRPESLSVDIGLEVSAGGKLIVVHGDVRAHMKLTIKWSSNEPVIKPSITQV